MKKEEAIVIIDSLNPGVIIKTSASDEKIKEAIGMAVKALQKEPVSEDLEEAAIEAFKQIVDSDKNNFLEIFKAGANWQKEQFEKKY